MHPTLFSVQENPQRTPEGTPPLSLAAFLSSPSDRSQILTPSLSRDGAGLPSTARHFFTRPPTGTPRRAISPREGLLILIPLLRGAAKATLYCAHRTSTVSSCAFCEQEGHLAAPLFIFLRPRVARAKKAPSLILISSSAAHSPSQDSPCRPRPSSPARLGIPALAAYPL